MEAGYFTMGVAPENGKHSMNEYDFNSLLRTDPVAVLTNFIVFC